MKLNFLTVIACFLMAYSIVASAFWFGGVALALFIASFFIDKDKK